jgi:hypothetical protein
VNGLLFALFYTDDDGDGYGDVDNDNDEFFVFFNDFHNVSKFCTLNVFYCPLF